MHIAPRRRQLRNVSAAKVWKRAQSLSRQRRQHLPACLPESFCSALMVMIDVRSRHANKGGGSREHRLSLTSACTGTHTSALHMFDYDQVIHWYINLPLWGIYPQENAPSHSSFQNGFFFFQRRADWRGRLVTRRANVNERRRGRFECVSGKRASSLLTCSVCHLIHHKWHRRGCRALQEQKHTLGEMHKLQDQSHRVDLLLCISFHILSPPSVVPTNTYIQNGTEIFTYATNSGFSTNQCVTSNTTDALHIKRPRWKPLQTDVSSLKVQKPDTLTHTHFYTRLQIIRQHHYGKAPRLVLTWGDPMTQSICVNPQLLVTDRPFEHNLLWQIKISAWQAEGREVLTERSESTLNGQYND